MTVLAPNATDIEKLEDIMPLIPKMRFRMFKDA
jgi:hypothetical protein